MRMPGTLVLMGRNSPRNSAGASGFMSYMSRWLGPPPRQIMITDFARACEATAPCALSRRKSGNARPPSANPPTLRKLRREIPSQKRSEASLKNVSIGDLLRQEPCPSPPEQSLASVRDRYKSEAIGRSARYKNLAVWV